MKKIITSMLILSLSLSLFACQNNENVTVNDAQKREMHDTNQDVSIQYEDSGFTNLPIKASTDIFAMDTVMTLSVYSDTKEKAKKALTFGAKELYQLDNLLSTNIVTSELYKINENGKGTFSNDGKILMKRSKELYEKTQGIFNIAIYPIVKAWGFTTDSFQVPSEKTLKDLLSISDFNLVDYNATTGDVSFKKQNMGIDFGGIAKGYASNRLMEIFKANGITSALVSLGGNVQLLGKKPNGQDFVVAIQNPNNPEDYFCTLKANDEAVITSGAYQRFFEDKGKIYHHIIDPKTASPANKGLTSVSIITKDGALGDSLATTLYILGKDKAIEFWQAHSNEFDMVLVDNQNHVYISENLKDRYTDNHFATPTIVRKA